MRTSPGWRGANGSNGGGRFASRLRRFRELSALAVVLALGGIAAGVAGPLLPAAVLVFGGELIGRYLFYVTVVPLDMPGSFYRSMA